MTFVLGVLFVAAAVFPLWGLIGLWRTATAEADEWAKAPAPDTDDPDSPSFGQFSALARILQRSVRTRPDAVRRDFLFVGIGVVLGLAADLLSLAT